MTVLSFHDSTGLNIDATAKRINKTLFLKLLGDIATALAGNLCRSNHIKFTLVASKVSFTPATGKYDLDLIVETFIELPQGDATFHNASNNPVVMTTFFGEGGLTSYSKEYFKMSS